MTFGDGTDNRVGADNRCGEKTKAIILQSFIDARTLAKSAVKWPHDGYDTRATNMLFGKHAHNDTHFVQLTSNIFQRASIDDTSTFPPSPELVVLTYNNYWKELDNCHVEPRAVAVTTPISDFTILFGSNGNGYSTQSKGNIDCIQFCPNFFQCPTIQQVQYQYQSFLLGAPDLDDLRTGGSAILHELIHTRLITDGEPREDVECANATIRGLDYWDMTMYRAGWCAAIAERSGLMGGGLNLTSQNEDCFVLSASGMFWADHFNGKMPGDGRPQETFGDLVASRLAGSPSEPVPLQLLAGTLGWILIIHCERVLGLQVRVQWLQVAGQTSAKTLGNSPRLTHLAERNSFKLPEAFSLRKP